MHMGDMLVNILLNQKGKDNEKNKNRMYPWTINR